MVFRTKNYVIEKLNYYDTRVFKLKNTHGFKIYLRHQDALKLDWLVVTSWIDFEDLYCFSFQEIDKKIDSILKMKAFW